MKIIPDHFPHTLARLYNCCRFIIPVEMLTGIPTNQIEAIIAHELAHINIRFLTKESNI